MNDIIVCCVMLFILGVFINALIYLLNVFIWLFEPTGIMTPKVSKKNFVYGVISTLIFSVVIGIVYGVVTFSSM